MFKKPKLGETKVELALARCGEEVLIKFEYFSYYHVSWESIEQVTSFSHHSFEAKIAAAPELEDPISDLDALVDLGCIPEDALKPEKVLTFRMGDKKKSRLWLVKWTGLKISESSWESEKLKILPRFGLSMTDLIDAFYLRNTSSTPPPAVPLIEDLPSAFLATHIGSDGHSHLRSDGTLYAYQVQSVVWILRNYALGRSCALAICMGAGKTVMSAVFLEFLFSTLPSSSRLPVLIVAPLSTLLNWRRELDKWTSSLQVVLFQGDKDDRELIKNFELSPVDLNSGKSLPPQSFSVFDIVLVSYETLSSQTSFLKHFRYSVGILDEAHRLKSESSLAREALLTLDIAWKLLLTGTPIQNNLRELWSLLNIIDSAKFADYSDFERRVCPTSAQIVDSTEYQNLTRPYVLRLSKEEVLKDKIPPKTEIIVEVQYTPEQRELYRQILAKNASLLAQSRVKAQLVNVSMELRKVLCHPYLIKGFEAALDGKKEGGLVKTSGKMVFLEKLIKRCWERKEKILVFSQMTKMLDIIEEFLCTTCPSATGPDFTPYERLDGNVGSEDRQKAIDRFNNLDAHESLVFLLSTNAGGVGVNLSAASVCVLYDSSFNPQQDSQAQARAHRIGNRSSKVTVYRLLTRDSYEMRLFEIAKQKLALEQALLAGTASLGDAPNSAAGGSGGVGFSAEELERLIIAGGREEMTAGTGVEERELSFDEMLAKHSRLVAEEGDENFDKAGKENAEEVVTGDSAEFWRRLATDVAMEETASVRKTRWQGSFAQTEPKPVVKQVVDEEKMRLKKLEAGWRAKGGEMYGREEFPDETEKKLFVSWVAKLYRAASEGYVGKGWARKLVGFRELQLLRRMIWDGVFKGVHLLNEANSVEEEFEQIRRFAEAEGESWMAEQEMTARGALAILNTLEAQYGLSQLGGRATEIGVRAREKWEEWLVENKEQAIWGDGACLQVALQAIKTLGLPVSYMPGKATAGTVAVTGGAHWQKADWTVEEGGDGGGELWGVEVATVDDAWAVEVEEWMRRTNLDEWRHGIRVGASGLFMTGDDICNLGRTLAELLKAGKLLGAGELAVADVEGNAVAMEVEEWSLESAVLGMWRRLVGDGQQAVLQRWRDLYMMRRDGEQIAGSTRVGVTVAEVEQALLGRLTDEELRSVVERLTAWVQTRKKEKAEREKDEEANWMRRNSEAVRSFVNSELVRGGGFSLATMEKILGVEWRKVLLGGEAIPVGDKRAPETPSVEVGESWRAWRAMEKIVGFAASARKADLVEEKIREIMRADGAKARDAVYEGPGGGTAREASGARGAGRPASGLRAGAAVVSRVVEELQKAGRGETEGEWVVFEDWEEARKALDIVQVIYMVRSLWLGGPRGSLWWISTGANFRERVEEIEKEIFLLGGQGELLLQIALEGVGADDVGGQTRKRRRADESGARTPDEVVGVAARIDEAKKFLAAFIDKKRPKKTAPAASGGAAEKNTLKKWLVPMKRAEEKLD